MNAASGRLRSLDVFRGATVALMILVLRSLGFNRLYLLSNQANPAKISLKIENLV